MMDGQRDDAYWWKGFLYIGLQSVPVAAGPLLSSECFGVEEHLVLPDSTFGLLDRSHGGKRLLRRQLAAARVHGDSMILKNIRDGDVALFWCSDFPTLSHGEIIVIEKIGDEEGWGAWALKTLKIEKPRGSSLNEFEDEIEWYDAEIVLHSANPSVSPKRLERSGEYRVRGVYLRAIEDVKKVDSDWIRGVVRGTF